MAAQEGELTGEVTQGGLGATVEIDGLTPRAIIGIGTRAGRRRGAVSAQVGHHAVVPGAEFVDEVGARRRRAGEQVVVGSSHVMDLARGGATLGEMHRGDVARGQRTS